MLNSLLKEREALLDRASYLQSKLDGRRAANNRRGNSPARSPPAAAAARDSQIRDIDEVLDVFEAAQARNAHARRVFSPKVTGGSHSASRTRPAPASTIADRPINDIHTELDLFESTRPAQTHTLAWHQARSRSMSPPTERYSTALSVDQPVEDIHMALDIFEAGSNRHQAWCDSRHHDKAPSVVRMETSAIPYRSSASSRAVAPVWHQDLNSRTQQWLHDYESSLPRALSPPRLPYEDTPLGASRAARAGAFDELGARGLAAR